VKASGRGHQTAIIGEMEWNRQVTDWMASRSPSLNCRFDYLLLDPFISLALFPPRSATCHSSSFQFPGLSFLFHLGDLFLLLFFEHHFIISTRNLHDFIIIPADGVKAA